MAELQLVLTHVGVEYRGFGTRPENQHGRSRRKLSGSCNIDVICEEGDDWRQEIPAIALIQYGGQYYCSGAMINNARNDGTPFFLTANHCGVGPAQAPSLNAYWNFESSTCIRGSTSGDGRLNQFSSGATHLFSSSISDVTLLQLNEPPSPAFGVTYLGWDRSGEIADSAVCIHHPDTDEKRISFENQPTTITAYDNTAGSGDTNIRVADWDKGTTEPVRTSILALNALQIIDI